MRKGKLSEEQRNAICQKYIEGLSSTQLAKKYSVSSQSILYILKKKNIKRRSPQENRKYHCNDSFLMKLTPKKKQYG